VKAAFESSNGDYSYQAQYLKSAMTISGNDFQNTLTNWSLGSGPGLVADPRVIPLLYTTNRTVGDLELQQFTGELDDQLHYGVAFVRVPDTHKFGLVEQHNWFSWNWARQIFFGDNGDDHDVFVIKRKQALSKDKFDATIKASTRHTAVIFVPGFRNTLEDGLLRFAQIIWDGQLGDMIPIVFSWPSRGDVKDYEYDGESAQNSVKSLESLIISLQNDDRIDNINIIAHSMGNRVVVDAIADMFGKQNVKPLSEIILAAPDVNKNRFLQEAKLIKESAKGATLYASSSDIPLGLSGDTAQMPRAGFVAPDGPLVVEGVDSIDVTAMGKDLFALNHGIYSDSSVIDDLALIIRSEIRPPSMRTARIRGVPEGSDHPRYWRYAN
jgi:esterase/lipase superfamily enzyme